jgi:ketosteroid isomerase-like protein
MTTMTPTMTARTSTTSDQELLALERSYWDAIKERDARTVGRLTAEDSTIVGASGVSGVDPRQMSKLLEGAPYRIKEYRIDPQTTRITHLCDGVVAISYGVHEDLEVDGKPVKLDAFDASVWKKTDAGWTCVLHTESIAGDSFGRDRVPATHAG